MGCPDIWFNIILGMSVRWFLGEINIGIGRLRVKQIALPKWLGLIQSAEGLNGTKRPSKRELSLSLPVFELGHPSSPSFRLRLDLYRQLAWVSSLLATDLSTSQPLELHQPIPYNKSLHTYLHINVLYLFIVIYL